MTSVTCPKCGLTFETRAVTNTRCRRCRYVVNIGRRPAASSPARRSATPGTSPPQSASERPSESVPEAQEPGTGLAVVGFGLAGAGAFGLVHGRRMEAGPARTRWLAGSVVPLVVGVVLVVVVLRSDDE